MNKAEQRVVSLLRHTERTVRPLEDEPANVYYARLSDRVHGLMVAERVKKRKAVRAARRASRPRKRH